MNLKRLYIIKVCTAKRLSVHFPMEDSTENKSLITCLCLPKTFVAVMPFYISHGQYSIVLRYPSAIKIKSSIIALTAKFSLSSCEQRLRFLRIPGAIPFFPFDV